MTPLFDLHPKASPRTLFGREAEVAELARLVREGRWVAVLGPRMVGKTSLLRGAAAKFGRPVVYVNLWGAHGTAGLLQALVRGLNEQPSLRARLGRALDRVEGVSVGSVGLTLRPRAEPMRTFGEILETIGREAPDSVLELDEVQEVAAASGTLHRLLANVFTTHPGVRFIFSGSKFGLLRTLLHPVESSPLFGRPPAALVLEPFDATRARHFLERGFSEYRLRFSAASLDGVISRSLGGVPGWLALFGSQVAVERKTLAAAEAATVAQGRKVAREELAHFLDGRDAALHWAAVVAIGSGSARWRDVRERLDARRGSPVNDHTAQRVLRSLQDAGFVSRAGERYVLPDPMVRSLARSLRRPPVVA